MLRQYLVRHYKYISGHITVNYCNYSTYVKTLRPGLDVKMAYFNVITEENEANLFTSPFNESQSEHKQYIECKMFYFKLRVIYEGYIYLWKQHFSNYEIVPQ